MRSLSVSFQNSSEKSVTSLVYCLRLQRPDGVVIGITNFDRPITLTEEPAVTYNPKNGMTPTALEIAGALNVTDLQFQAFLSTDDISKNDIEAGLFNYSEIKLFQIDWSVTPYSQANINKMLRGHIGEIQRGQNTFTAELRSLTQKMQNPLNNVYTIGCRVPLFSSQCGLNSDDFLKISAITATDSNFHFQINTATLDNTPDYYNDGTVEVTSGANAGFKKEIKTLDYGTGEVFVKDPFPYVFAVTDTLKILPGCNKSIKQCHEKFANTANFRGFPHIPGRDYLTKGIL